MSLTTLDFLTVYKNGALSMPPAGNFLIADVSIMKGDKRERLYQLGGHDLISVRAKMLAALSCANLLVANLDGYSKVDWLYINNLVLAGRRELCDARKIIDKQDGLS